MKQGQEAGGPARGPPVPPPAPHGGRSLTGSPDGPAGARREEKLEEKSRREAQEGGTA